MLLEGDICGLRGVFGDPTGDGVEGLPMFSVTTPRERCNEDPGGLATTPEFDTLDELLSLRANRAGDAAGLPDSFLFRLPEEAGLRSLSLSRTLPVTDRDSEGGGILLDEVPGTGGCSRIGLKLVK
jgi:hypothetical protein